MCILFFWYYLKTSKEKKSLNSENLTWFDQHQPGNSEQVFNVTEPRASNLKHLGPKKKNLFWMKYNTFFDEGRNSAESRRMNAEWRIYLHWSQVLKNEICSLVGNEEKDVLEQN